MERFRSLLLTPEISEDSELIKDFNYARRMLQCGAYNHLGKEKRGLVILGGGMRGVYGGGIVTGLTQVGIVPDIFDVAVGVSAGASDIAYYVSQQPELGTSIYYQELATRKFINPLRAKNKLNLAYLDKTFRQTKPLDQNVIRNAYTETYVGVTNVETVEGEYLNLQDDSIDVVTALCASAAIPELTQTPIEIKGKKYLDGSTGCVNPVQFAIDKGCTKILVISNNPFESKQMQPPLVERLAGKLLLRSYSPEFREVHLTRTIRQKPINDFQEGITLGILSPNPVDIPISQLSTDGEMMEIIAIHAAAQARRIFK